MGAIIAFFVVYGGVLVIGNFMFGIRFAMKAVGLMYFIHTIVALLAMSNGDTDVLIDWFAITFMGAGFILQAHLNNKRERDYDDDAEENTSDETRTTANGPRNN